MVSKQQCCQPISVFFLCISVFSVDTHKKTTNKWRYLINFSYFPLCFGFIWIILIKQQCCQPISVFSVDTHKKPIIVPNIIINNDWQSEIFPLYTLVPLYFHCYHLRIFFPSYFFPLVFFVVFSGRILLHCFISHSTLFS